MNKPSNFTNDTFVDSILNIKASGSINNDILEDLLLPDGKAIAELLNDQKEKTEADHPAK